MIPGAGPGSTDMTVVPSTHKFNKNGGGDVQQEQSATSFNTYVSSVANNTHIKLFPSSPPSSLFHTIQPTARDESTDADGLPRPYHHMDLKNINHQKQNNNISLNTSIISNGQGNGKNKANTTYHTTTIYKRMHSCL